MPCRLCTRHGPHNARAACPLSCRRHAAPRFFPAVGSGVYLNLGRTWLLYRKSDVSALHAQWARDDPQARDGASNPDPNPNPDPN